MKLKKKSFSLLLSTLLLLLLIFPSTLDKVHFSQPIALCRSDIPLKGDTNENVSQFQINFFLKKVAK